MATEVIKKVKPSGQGGDYTTLQAWEAGEQGDLVSLDEIHIGEIDGDWTGTQDTATLTVDGSTTDATRYMVIRAVNDARHKGYRSPKCYVRTTQIALNDDYTRVSGIYLYTSVGAINVNNAGNCIIESCIGYTSQASATGRMFLGSTTATASCYFINCIAESESSSYMRGFNSESTGITHYFYNCTSVRCLTGFRRAAGTMVCKNCIAQLCVDGYSVDGNVISNHNLSDIAADAPGTTTFTGTVTFINIATLGLGIYLLSQFDTTAKKRGANLSNDTNYSFNTDINKQIRFGIWDIGVDQYINNSNAFFAFP